MNLRVDLILETEQRSGSAVNAKMLTRIGSIVVPVILLTLLGWQMMRVRQLQRDYEDLQADWELRRPQSEKARTLTQQFGGNKDVKQELDGWRHSRLDWGAQLIGVIEATPTNVQLNALRITQVMRWTERNAPSRNYTLSLKGTAVADRQGTSVKTLESSIQHGAAFTACVAEVSVPVYAADTRSGAERDDRIFELQCAYNERLLE